MARNITGKEPTAEEATEAESKGGQNSEAMTSPFLLFRALDW